MLKTSKVFNFDDDKVDGDNSSEFEAVAEITLSRKRKGQPGGSINEKKGVAQKKKDTKNTHHLQGRIRNRQNVDRRKQ